MQKTFEEIMNEVDEKYYWENNYYLSKTNEIEFAETCMKIVREQTIKECLDICQSTFDIDYCEKQINDLSKNSIEI